MLHEYVRTKHGYTRSSKVCHDLQNDFHTIVVRFQVRSSTVCYGLVRLNTTFTRLTGHLQGLHTVPTTFDRVRFHDDLYTILTRLISLVEWTSSAVVYTGLYGLIRSLTVLYDR